MRRTKAVSLGEATVSVHELTVGEIRNWLRDLDSAGDRAGTDLVGAVLFEEISFDDLKRLSNVTEAQLDAATPGELRALIEAARELNADFFGMRARLAAIGQAALAAAPAPSSARLPG